MGGGSSLRRLAPAWRWLGLALLSALLAALLEGLRLPAALLLGPMAAAVLFAIGGAGLALPAPAFFLAQGVVGVMVAGNLPAEVFDEIARDAPIFLAGTASTVAVASLIGWLLARSGTLPGTTAIWGSTPGAATTMTVMSADYGADMRLVAVMQYLRVVCCALAAMLVALLLGARTLGEQHVDWFPAQPWGAVAGTLAIAAAGAFLGARLRLPGGAVLLPMGAGMAVQLGGLMPVTLPPTVLAVSYALIGWAIGINFDRAVLAHAARVLPRLLASILALIAASAACGLLLVLLAGIDPLTALLATSPGGADSIAIIATATRADIPFVMAMQVARFLLVVLAGPALARLLSGERGRRSR
ncbi:MAG: AbrB family transcriptional regulator [Dongiaceae bacterium]